MFTLRTTFTNGCTPLRMPMNYCSLQEARIAFHIIAEKVTGSHVATMELKSGRVIHERIVKNERKEGK